MSDQAERLRELVRQWEVKREGQRSRIIAITSGKGGVGKTNLAVNLALALKEQGNTVTLFDADLGLANVDVVLGTSPPYTLAHVVRRERSFAEVVYSVHGLQVVAGGSGVEELVELPEFVLKDLVREAASLNSDFFLIDTGAGLSRAVINLALAAQEVLVVTTPEPTALTDAYALIKVLLKYKPNLRLNLVVNRVHTPKEGERVAANLQKVVQKFLNGSLTTLGYVPEDGAVRSSVLKQEPLLFSYPHAPAARQLRLIAGSLSGQSRTTAGEGFSNFLTRLRSLF